MTFCSFGRAGVLVYTTMFWIADDGWFARNDPILLMHSIPCLVSDWLKRAKNVPELVNP